MSPRRPFPPEDRESGPEFRNLFTLVAMGFVGSTCGGNLPMIPTWIGSLAGAGSFLLVTTAGTAQGDLARTMGMRIVALIEEVLDINAELRVVQKLGTVSGKILDKILILDRKHRIKDRIISGVSFAYNQISRAARQEQTDFGDERRDDGPPRRREGGRRGPRMDESRPNRGPRFDELRQDPRDSPRDAEGREPPPGSADSRQRQYSPQEEERMRMDGMRNMEDRGPPR